MARGRRQSRIDITGPLGSYFEMVSVCDDMGVSGLMEDGLSANEARRRLGRLHKEMFTKGDSAHLRKRLMRAGIWRRR